MNHCNWVGHQGHRGLSGGVRESPVGLQALGHGMGAPERAVMVPSS